MNVIAAAAQAPPTNWGTFWAYAAVMLAGFVAVGGVTIGYVRMRLNTQEIILKSLTKSQSAVIKDIRRETKRQRKQLRRDFRREISYLITPPEGQKERRSGGPRPWPPSPA